MAWPSVEDLASATSSSTSIIDLMGITGIVDLAQAKSVAWPSVEDLASAKSVATSSSTSISSSMERSRIAQSSGASPFSGRYGWWSEGTYLRISKANGISIFFVYSEHLWSSITFCRGLWRLQEEHRYMDVYSGSPWYQYPSSASLLSSKHVIWCLFLRWYRRRSSFSVPNPHLQT